MAEPSALGAVVEPKTAAVESRTLVVDPCSQELALPCLRLKDRLPDTEFDIVWLNAAPAPPRPLPETRPKLLVIDERLVPELPLASDARFLLWLECISDVKVVPDIET